jgi:hypothetical protein
VTASQQVAVPAQDRVRADQQPQLAQGGPRKVMQESGQPGPVGWLEPDPLPVELTLQHRELMP